MTASAPAPSPWAGHPQGSPEYRRILVSLFFSGLATFAQLYSTQSVLPAIADEFGVSAPTSALTVSGATIGMAIAVLFWAAIADRYGRVQAMTVSLISATVFGLIGLFAPSIWLLVAARILEGAALGGVPGVAVAFLSEELDHRHIASAAAIFVSGNSVGGLVGRVLSGMVSGWTGSWRLGVMAVVVMCAIAVALFIVLIPRARGFIPLRRRPPELMPATTAWQRIMENLRDPGQMTLYLQGFMYMGSFVAVYNYLGFRLTHAPYHLPIEVVSLLFVTFLIGTITSPFAGRAAEQYGRLSVLLVAAGTMAAGALITLAGPLWLIFVGLLIFTAGFFGTHSICSGWVGVRHQTGRAQASSLYNLFYYTGSSVLGWFAGYWFHAGGWPGVVVLVVVCAAIAAVTVSRVLREHPSAQRPDMR